MKEGSNQRQERPADWQMPAGVTAGLWDYLQSAELAKDYDSYLGDSAIARVDTRLVREYAQGAQRALDLGCGTGRTLLALAEASVPEIVGVDLSSCMLERARAKTTAHQGRVTLLQENLVTLASLKDDSF